VAPNGLVLRYFDVCGEEVVPASGGELEAAERARIRRVTVALTLREAAGAAITAEVASMLRNRQALRCE
jgi:hypothetical protein